MLKHNRNNGFTIIEVSIAIALIMGGMIVAVVSINSRLRQENFYKGASRFGSVLNDVFNDVETSNWPHVDEWKCQWPGWPNLSSNHNDIEFVGQPGHQTGDGDCLYVGKVVQFGDERTVVDDDGTYIIHTIMTHRSALIPIYDFDSIVKPPSTSNPRIHPLGVLEKPGTPGFSTRETKSWPNGMQVKQVYYLEDPSDPISKVYLQGIAAVQQAGHGLKENDILLQTGGSRQVAYRVIHQTPIADARLPGERRPNSNDFAASLKRTPGTSAGANEAAISSNFNLPIYICAGDGRGLEVLALIGGHVETEFDEDVLQTRCN